MVLASSIARADKREFQRSCPFFRLQKRASQTGFFNNKSKETSHFHIPNMAGPTETSPLNAENIEKVKVKATEAGKNVVAYAVSVANGNASIRVMALAGGAAMVFDSIGNFFNDLFGLNFIQAIIAFYAFMVGASAVIMESDKDAIPYAEKLRGIIGKNLGVVRTVTGRGLFYGVAATLEISQVRDAM